MILCLGCKSAVAAKNSHMISAARDYTNNSKFGREQFCPGARRCACRRPRTSLTGMLRLATQTSI